MAALSRVIVVIPLVLSIVGFVLSALSLFAGQKQGFMEDYAVARLNVSMIGKDMMRPDGRKGKDDGGEGGILGTLKDKFDNVKDDFKGELNDLVGDAVGGISDKVGISDWYSIHVMDACEGYFEPNATMSGASLNTTNCTHSSPGYRLNITKMLDKELSVGPVDVNLSDLGWSDDIQDKLDIFNSVLLGLFVLYALGMGLSGINMLGCAAAGLLPERRGTVLANLVAGVLAALSLIIASLIVTVALTKGINEVNGKGRDIGVEAIRGTKFLILSWVAAGVMLSTAVFWGVRFWVLKKAQADTVPPKEAS